MSFSEPPTDGQWTTGDQSPEPTPVTLSQGELVPPPRKPPTAISASPAGPEPRPPRPLRGRTSGRTGFPLPRELVRAVDAALDILDDLGDALRTAVGRVAR
ncbi:MAG TPA: hypothetical protein VM076_00250 [Gemmatimonadaceae bacterium]|nr:hypothetical protein [Gemmatimonadaceae bacterium]